jgi:hypothetical protein
MSRHNTIRATLAITAATFAFGATSAGAMPMRDGSPPASGQETNGPHGMQFYDAGHASLAIEQSQAQAAAQDMAHLAAGADLRGESAKDAAHLARLHAAGGKIAPLGQPQFSTTKVTALHSTQLPANDDGNDVPLVGIILGLAGAGLLGVGAGVAVSKTTRSRHARVAA